MPRHELLLDMTDIVLRYETFSVLMEFYPGGLHGLLHDYLCMYIDEALKPSKNSRLDYLLMDRILDTYFNSCEYRVQQLAVPNPENEHTIGFICLAISLSIREVVAENIDFFRLMPTKPLEARWADNYLMLEVDYKGAKFANHTREFVHC